MINSILFIIGFLLTAGTFGTQFIAGVDLMQYWLWFVAVLATILGIVIIAITSIGAKYLAQDSNLKIPFISSFSGGVIGSFIAILIAGISYVQLWLSYVIIDGIPKAAVSFAEFPINTQYAIYAFIAIIVFNLVRSISFKSK